ncbi:MAG: TonB-dependent receptor [Acidobacteria bacterium]|nr:TonB-dependent receptor [Acidobacteriota bacterium]
MTVRFARAAALSGLLLGVAWTPAVAEPAAQAAVARKARVTGIVRDEFNNISLPGVPVEVVGQGETVYTDIDGRYSVDLAPGSYQLKVSMDGYQERLLALEVPAGQRTVVADVGLSMAKFAETVVVRGEAPSAEIATTEAQLTERKRASVITDNLGGQEMKDNADSDAAAAMSRVTGLSVVDNQYVFVRGLGERYSNTTLNGAVIPTTEPDKKVVALDLFPSGLLSSVSVAKSYTPDRSAEFAGGLVEVMPLKFPSQTVLDFSYSLGFNSQTTGDDVLGYAGSGSDWRGFDNGLRALPSAVPNRKVIRGGIYTPNVGVLTSELETIGESFANNWNLRSRQALPNQSGGATFGARAGKVGFIGSYTQSYREQFNEERQVYYRTGQGGTLTEFSDYDFDIATRRASIGAVGNVSLQMTPNQRVTWENFYSHSGRDEARQFEGFNSDINTTIRNQRLFWIEEDLLSTGLTGEHFFSGAGNSRIDWRATVSKAQRDEPDLREVLYEFEGNRFILSDESQSGLRMFNTLDDDSKDFAGSWSVFRTINELPTQFKFGGQYIERTRDFSSRRFRYVPVSNRGINLGLQPEDIFTPQNIRPGAFELKEETRVTDAYAAEQTTAAFYGMTDLALSTRARLIAGARVERFDQRVDTFDLFDFEGDPDIIRAQIKKTDIFPGVNFVYSVRANQNVRVSFSQTVNRPEFRELAPFEFTDVVGGRAVVGNPDLERALIQNYDARYEIFPGSDEVFAVSFFYKRFDNPIERIVEPTAQLRTSFTNADSAKNYGFEVEARKRLGPNLLVGANYTWVDSSITLTPAAAQVQTSLERPLAGQSKNLFNLVAEANAGPASIRLLYNFFDDRIADVGSVGLPDIIEQSRGILDLVVSARVFRKLNVRASIDNLTDADYEFTQGGQLQRLFNLGRTFTLNFGFSPF